MGHRNIDRVELTEDTLEEFLSCIDRSKRCSIDSETTGLVSWHKNFQVVCMTMACSHNKGWIVWPENFHLMKEVIQRDDILWIGHNLKYDEHAFSRIGLSLGPNRSDTMMQSYCIDASGSHGLKQLSLRYLDEDDWASEMDAWKKDRGDGSGMNRMLECPRDKVFIYATLDATMTFLLWEYCYDYIKKNGLEKYESWMNRLTWLMSEIESNGVEFDSNRALDVVGELQGIYDDNYKGLMENELVQALNEYSINKNNEFFDPRNDDHIVKLLFGLFKFESVKKDKRTGKPAVNNFILDNLYNTYKDENIIRVKICRHIKLFMDNIMGLLNHDNTVDKRIHAQFLVHGAKTGRISSSDPNLMGIPSDSDYGKLIRGVFVSRYKNGVLLSSDAKQAEMRILASFCGSKKLIDIFNSNLDVYVEVAKILFEKDDISDFERDFAKIITIGMVYGRTVWGIAKEMKKSEEWVRSFFDKYFNMFDGIREYCDKSIYWARNRGWVRSPYGDVYRFLKINAVSIKDREEDERCAINYRIQGTSSHTNLDILMRVLKRIKKDYTGRAVCILVNHDEFLFDCDSIEMARILSKIIDEESIGLMDSLRDENGELGWMKIPFVYEHCIGDNWGEMEKLV